MNRLRLVRQVSFAWGLSIAMLYAISVPAPILPIWENIAVAFLGMLGALFANSCLVGGLVRHYPRLGGIGLTLFYSYVPYFGLALVEIFLKSPVENGSHILQLVLWAAAMPIGAFLWTAIVSAPLLLLSGLLFGIFTQYLYKNRDYLPE